MGLFGYSDDGPRAHGAWRPDMRHSGLQNSQQHNTLNRGPRRATQTRARILLTTTTILHYASCRQSCRKPE